MSTNCIHYWMIESPDEAYKRSGSGKFSSGKCKHCGEKRDNFMNIIDYRTWNNHGLPYGRNKNGIDIKVNS